MVHKIRTGIEVALSQCCLRVTSERFPSIVWMCIGCSMGVDGWEAGVLGCTNAGV